MNKASQANLETIHAALFTEDAQRGRQLIASFRKKGSDRKASWLLRHHDEGVITDRETYPRDDVDYLLSYYSMIMVAITAGLIDPKPDEPLLESAADCLTYVPLRNYYELKYPLVLPQRLLTWLNGQTSTGLSARSSNGEEQSEDEVRRIFSPFLYLTAMLEHDEEMEGFLWILDGGWREEWNYDRLKKTLGKPEKAAALLAKSTRDPVGRRLVHGVIKFLQFSCSLDELLSASEAYPQLQEEMYLYHSYWFSASEDLFGRMLDLLATLRSVGGNVGTVRRHLKSLKTRGTKIRKEQTLTDTPVR